MKEQTSMSYAILESDLPDDKQKPKLTTCLAVSLATMLMVATSITVGIFIGYAYCYLEHRTGFESGNMTENRNMHIIRMPHSQSKGVPANRTLNGAIMSNYLVSRILNIGQAMLHEEISLLPWSHRVPPVSN